MRITFWGARGSIPVSGCEYQKYGGDTTCVEIRTKNDEVIIIDAGSGIRKLGIKLLAEKRFKFHMLFTHAHWDHLIGFPFFKPIYFKGTQIDMYGHHFALESITEIVSKSMRPPFFPVNFDDIGAEITSKVALMDGFQIDSVTIIPVPISHPNQGLGYKIIEGDKTFVFITDNELSYRHHEGLEYSEYMEFSKNADLLVHDAEYTEEQYKFAKTWGHSIYKDAHRLALEANVKQFGLFHHNQERSDEALDLIVEDCNKMATEANSPLISFGVQALQEITL
jgi:phosphoribosyl 1,2-cyclic phosphodiesterase